MCVRETHRDVNIIENTCSNTLGNKLKGDNNYSSFSSSTLYVSLLNANQVLESDLVPYRLFGD